MRENFLTIPDAPNYEINSKLVVRNKKTGYIMTPQISPNGSKFYSLPSAAVPSGHIGRTDVALRRQAVDATKPTTFEPIPSVGGKYEVDCKGNVRNASTKKRLKPNCKDVFSMYDVSGKKFVFRSRNSLIWEVHGIFRCGWARVGVRAEYKNQRFTFTTCAECARFLLNKLPYALNTLQCYLWRRQPAFAGWSFTYIEQLPGDIEWDNRGLNRCARRNLKVLGSSGQN